MKKVIKYLHCHLPPIVGLSSMLTLAEDHPNPDVKTRYVHTSVVVDFGESETDDKPRYIETLNTIYVPHDLNLNTSIQETPNVELV